MCIGDGEVEIRRGSVADFRIRPLVKNRPEVSSLLEDSHFHRMASLANQLIERLYLSR